MSTPTPVTQPAVSLTKPWSREAAVQKMYDAEVAVHCARQSQVEAWIEAAYRRLHEAIEAYALAS